MNKINNMMMVFSIIFLLMGGSFSATVIGDNYVETRSNEEYDLTQDKYQIAIYQTSTKERYENSQVLSNITQKEFEILKEKIFSESFESHRSIDLYEKIEILRNYNILPKTFSVENITNSLNKLREKNNILCNFVPGEKEIPSFANNYNNGGVQDAYFNPGPHFFIYCSLGTVALSQPVTPFAGFIDDVTWTKPMEEVFPPLTLLFNNSWVSNYGFWSAVQFLLGNSFGFYGSLGITPNPAYGFVYPFFAIFVPSVSWGVYVYRLQPDGTTNTPLMDFYFGFSLLSVQIINPFGQGQIYP